MIQSEYKINPDRSITFTLSFENEEDRENWRYSMEETRPVDLERVFLYEWHNLDIVDPEENGDMTEGIIFTDGWYDWWDSNYAVSSFLAELTEKGTYTFPFERLHRQHFDDSYSAEEFLETYAGFYDDVYGIPDGGNLPVKLIDQIFNEYSQHFQCYDRGMGMFKTNIEIAAYKNWHGLGDIIGKANLVSSLVTNIAILTEGYNESLHRQ